MGEKERALRREAAKLLAAARRISDKKERARLRARALDLLTEADRLGRENGRR